MALTPEELPILRGLSDDHRREIMETTLLHEVPAGSLLFEQGDLPNFQIVVMSGRCGCSADRPKGGKCWWRWYRRPI